MPAIGLGTFGSDRFTGDVRASCVTCRSPDAKPYIHERFMATWRQMEKLVADGLVRHIGMSNMTVPNLELVLRDEEMATVAGIDRHCRLIKGQVFLWKDGQTWEDLWDLSGEITPP